jgi:hypothetical protein
MSPVSAADRSDAGRMARGSEPVVNGGTDLSALQRRLARSVVPGDQKHDAFAMYDRAPKTVIDRPPRLVEVLSVQVDHPIGIVPAAFQPPVPR